MRANWPAAPASSLADGLHPALLQKGDDGRLGNGADSDQGYPVPVSSASLFAAVSAGAHHTCAITTAGALLCWGLAPANGQSNNTDKPAEVGGGYSFAALSAGFEYTCVLDTSREAWCFGAPGLPRCRAHATHG